MEKVVEKHIDPGFSAPPAPSRVTWRDESTIAPDTPPGGSPASDDTVEARTALAALATSLKTLLSEFSSVFGGWWQRRTVPDLLVRYTPEDDTYYRAHFVHSDRGERVFERVRPAYMLGHLSALNPENADATWSDLEPRLASAWGEGARSGWSDVRRYAWDAFTRASSTEYRGWRTRQLDSE